MDTRMDIEETANKKIMSNPTPLKSIAYIGMFGSQSTGLMYTNEDPPLAYVSSNYSD